MTDSEINKRIAELCGWKPNGKGYWFKDGHCACLHGETHDECGGIGDDHIDALPDYCNDLNAMHEAEKMLKDQIRFEYEVKLHTLNTKYGIGISVWETLHAPAHQRAEAFLKASNTWEE